MRNRYPCMQYVRQCGTVFVFRPTFSPKVKMWGEIKHFFHAAAGGNGRQMIYRVRRINDRAYAVALMLPLVPGVIRLLTPLRGTHHSCIRGPTRGRLTHHGTPFIPHRVSPIKLYHVAVTATVLHLWKQRAPSGFLLVSSCTTRPPVQEQRVHRIEDGIDQREQRQYQPRGARGQQRPQECQSTQPRATIVEPL